MQKMETEKQLELDLENIRSEKEQLLENKNNGQTLFITFKGISATFSAVILYTISVTCVQLLERRIPDMELNTFRLGVPLLLYILGLMIVRRWPVIEKSEIWATLAFVSAASGSGLCAYVAVTLLPASTVSCLSCTSTILFGLFLFSLCWNERVTVKQTVFASLCAAGVILIIQPWIGLKQMHSKNGREPSQLDNYFHDHGNNNTYNIQLIGDQIEPIEATYQIAGYIAAVGSGLCVALEVLVVKRNPYLNDHPLEILFWGWTFGTLVSIALMFIIETPVLPSNWFDTTMVFIHSATCAFIWPLFMYGSRTISGNTVAIIVSSNVVLMLFSQYTVLSSIHPGHRNWMEVVGVVLVLLGSSMSSILELIMNNSRRS